MRWASLVKEGGAPLDYAVFEPDGFSPDRAWPVLLVLPPGPGDRDFVERALELYFTSQARARGWVLVSPAAPAGVGFHEGAASRLVALLDRIEREYLVEGGCVHLAGISNGGRAAFTAAGLFPHRFASLSVAPGMPGEAEWERLADLAHLPISVHVGEWDDDWVGVSRRTAERLRELGAPDVQLTIHEGEDHVLGPALGAAFFDRLEQVRAEQRKTAEKVSSVSVELDDFHDAAAKADETRYFAHFAPGAVFVGTDGSERWSLAEFRAFAEPYFQRESAWTYVPTERHVRCLGGVAWFEEKLANEKYGETRGSGVLVQSGDRWLISQYVLSLAIPNDAAAEVVEVVRSRSERK